MRQFLTLALVASLACGPAFAQVGPGPAPGGGTPGGSSGQAQCNNAGAFGGITATDGQVIQGQASGCPAGETVSGDATITDAGVVTVNTVKGGSTPVVKSGSFVSGNCPQFSGTAGALVDSGSATCGGGGSSLYPAAISGNWYSPPNANAVAGTALTGSRMNCQQQINVLSGLTVKTLGARITTLGSSNIQLAIYANSAGKPNGAPLGATGNIVDTSTGAVSAAPAGGNFSLPAGPYWSCVVANDSTVVLQATSNVMAQTSAYAGSATLATVTSSSTVFGMSVFQAITFGSWPTVTGTGWTELTTQTAGGIVFFQAN